MEKNSNTCYNNNKFPVTQRCNDMLNYVISKTLEFLEGMPKSVRKKKGQFFTSKETAEFMAQLFDFSNLSKKIEILDPGAGTGILSAALLDRAFSENLFSEIQLTCYENDLEVLPVLRENLEYIQAHAPIKFGFVIVVSDYLISQAPEFEGKISEEDNLQKYDLIIGNPPYLRVMRDNPAAMAMPTVVHGAPNLYFLFAAMSLFNLKNEAEMVYIIPRSWTSGEYFKVFRKYFLRYGKIEQIHLFVSRDKVFSQEQVLQETIIIKIKKTAVRPQHVIISSSQTNNDYNNMTEIAVPYNSVVSGKNLYVYLPTSNDDVKVIRTINKYKTTFPDIGLRMRTGIVVDFRQRNELRKEQGEHIIPLFYGQHIKNGVVTHVPSGKDFDWIVDEKPGLIQKNKNYVFCKRFTAKEEKRRLQCGIYLAENFPEYEYIGTQNKINYVDCVDGAPLSTALVYGIYALLNTTLYDKYYRILNGSTQVNSTEVNNIPVPPIETIEKIGNRLIKAENLTTECCDEIVEEEAYCE